MSAKRSLYVSRKVKNAGDIIAWAKAQGFKSTLRPDDMHATVAYSREPVDWSAAGDHFDHVRAGHDGRSVQPLGDKGAVVLKFRSKELSDRWRQFRDAGASWDFPSYQPHVTITYDGNGVDLGKVEPYSGVIDFGPEEYAELDPAWDKKIRESPMAKSIVVLTKSFVGAYVRGGRMVAGYSNKHVAHAQPDHRQLTLFRTPDTPPPESLPEGHSRKHYVTMVREHGTAAQKVGWLAGPFDTNEEAAKHVDAARKKASEVDPFSDFDAFGTSSRVAAVHKPGVLNRHLGIAS